MLRYNILDKRWIAENIAGFADFLEQCEGIAFVQGLFTCKNHHNILTERGMMVRGVQDRGKDWIRTQNAVLLGNTSQDTNDLITLTGAQYTTGSFLYIAKTWYHLHHMSLIPLDTELPSIAVPFDHILSADVFDDEVIIVGIRSGKHYIALFTHRHPENMRLIPFPEEAGTADIRVYRAHKNLFIKTRNALLFLYQGSDVLEWITQGNILLVGDGFGLYEYEGEIWEVYWDARYEKNT